MPMIYDVAKIGLIGGLAYVGFKAAEQGTFGTAFQGAAQDARRAITTTASVVEGGATGAVRGASPLPSAQHPSSHTTTGGTIVVPKDGVDLGAYYVKGFSWDGAKVVLIEGWGDIPPGGEVAKAGTLDEAIAQAQLWASLNLGGGRN